MSELRTALEVAIAECDATAVAERLACGDSPMDLNHLQIPVLFDALRSNETALLELLHDAGADWSTPYNDGGFTPLIYASLYGDLATVRWLVDQGQAVNQRTALGVGVMHVAVQRPDPSIAHYLYHRGADAFVRTGHGESPLLLSLQSKHGLGQFRFMLWCYADAKQSLASEFESCLVALFKGQRSDAAEALHALLALIDVVPDETELRGILAAPENRVANPFRSLDATLSSRLSHTLFALLKAERVARSSVPVMLDAPRWEGPGAL